MPQLTYDRLDLIVEHIGQYTAGQFADSKPALLPILPTKRTPEGPRQSRLQSLILIHGT